jgi:hypothetical protein
LNPVPAYCAGIFIGESFKQTTVVLKTTVVFTHPVMLCTTPLFAGQRGEASQSDAGVSKDCGCLFEQLVKYFITPSFAYAGFYGRQQVPRLLSNQPSFS